MARGYREKLKAVSAPIPAILVMEGGARCSPNPKTTQGRFQERKVYWE